jgi:proline iminopeptidase
MALEYTRRFPHRVSHLVLLASSPVTGPHLYQAADDYFQEQASTERKEALAASMEKFMNSGDASFVGRMLAFGPRLWFDAHFDASSLWQDTEINVCGAGILWGSMFANYDTAAALKTLDCPVFLGLGKHDYFNPPHLWEPYKNLVSDLTCRVFEHSGHTPSLEESDAFDHRLLQWLDATAGSTR